MQNRIFFLLTLIFVLCVTVTGQSAMSGSIDMRYTHIPSDELTIKLGNDGREYFVRGYSYRAEGQTIYVFRPTFREGNKASYVLDEAKQSVMVILPKDRRRYRLVGRWYTGKEQAFVIPRRRINQELVILRK